jgi:hypothetical protein
MVKLQLKRLGTEEEVKATRRTEIVSYYYIKKMPHEMRHFFNKKD